MLCPVAAAMHGQPILAESEALHTLHLVLSVQPSAAESAADTAPYDCSIERALLVSGERGLLLATQLQDLVSAQRVGGA